LEVWVPGGIREGGQLQKVVLEAGLEAGLKANHKRSLNHHHHHHKREFQALLPPSSKNQGIFNLKMTDG
jgi:hypothetical protein